MRRRLLLSYLSVSVFSVLLVCLPVGFVGTSLIRQDFDHRLQRNLQNVAAAVDALTARGVTVTAAELGPLVPSDRRAVLRLDNGRVVTAGQVHGATRALSKPVTNGRLDLQAPLSLLHQRVLNLWLLIAGLGMAALAVAAFVGFRVARRLSRPLAVLSATATRIGHGDLQPAGDRFGIRELDQLAQALDTGAARLARVLADERRFVRDASHQLRTPLTSLTVRLEDIRRRTDDDEIRKEIDAALRQVERLTEVTSTALRHRAIGLAPHASTDVAALIRAQREEWRPAFDKLGRELCAVIPDSLHARGDATAIEQALATLLDNALVHGAGRTELRARTLGNHIVIDVSDEGRGVDPDIEPHIFVPEVSSGAGTGLGLPLARSLIEAQGGRLTLGRRSPALFSIFLEVADQRTGATAGARSDDASHQH